MRGRPRSSRIWLFSSLLCRSTQFPACYPPSEAPDKALVDHIQLLPKSMRTDGLRATLLLSQLFWSLGQTKHLLRLTSGLSILMLTHQRRQQPSVHSLFCRNHSWIWRTKALLPVKQQSPCFKPARSYAVRVILSRKLTQQSLATLNNSTNHPWKKQKRFRHSNLEASK